MVAAKEAKESKNLSQKLAEVILDIGPQKPEGYNDFHRYSYYSDEQISTMFRERLASRNIIIIPTVVTYDVQPYQTDKQKHSFLTSLTIEWRIVDGDSGETMVAVTVGQGDDPGDKGANKAMTGAFKYFLLKLGLVGGGTDAEADTKTDQRAAGMVIGKSDIKGIARGGRSTNATEAQVRRVSMLARDLGIDAAGTALIVMEVLDREVDLGTDDPGPALASYLATLSADDIGKIVQAMAEMKESTEVESGVPEYG